MKELKEKINILIECNTISLAKLRHDRDVAGRLGFNTECSNLSNSIIVAQGNLTELKSLLD